VQRAAAAAALPQLDFKQVGRNGKPQRSPRGWSPSRGSSHATSAESCLSERQGRRRSTQAAFVNVALSKVAPAYVRTEAFRISVQGRLLTTVRFGASAAMLLRYPLVRN